MAQIQTFDHCGFMVEDIPRSHKFYSNLLGAKPLHTANLTTKTYTGWPIISFVEMGGHRFELCLAREPLSPTEESNGFPSIGFAVTDETLRDIEKQLKDSGIPYEPVSYPEAVPLKETIRLRDPDGNRLEFSTRR